jgi:FkbM family methyltransferase
MNFPTMKRRLSKVLRISQEQGPYAGARFILLHILEDRWLLGKVIEIVGNSAHLDGCAFHLDSPYIATRLKSRFLLGTWEEEARYLVKRYLPANLPVIELGACIGVVSCLTNRLLMRPESHIVVEANKHLLPILETHREKNGCRFKILGAAIAYGAEEVTFYLDDGFNEGSTVRHTPQAITVPTITLQGILDREGFSRVSLICDIEGTELELVETEGDTMSSHVEWFIAEVHGQVKSAKTRSYLEALGFRLIEQFNHNHIYRNQRLAPGATH